MGTNLIVWLSQQMNKPLRVVHWNARGLAKKVASLLHVLQEQDIDVALISETHLGPKQKISFPGFIIYRRDELSVSGKCYRGLAVLVSVRIVHKLLKMPSFNTLYTLGIIVVLGGVPLELHAAYKPPNIALIPNDVWSLLNVRHPVILAGDFNSIHPQWNLNINNRNTSGVRLQAHSEDKGYTISGPNEPTRYPEVCGDTCNVLDILVLNKVPYTIAQEVLYDIGSDHRPVLVVLEPVTNC